MDLGEIARHWEKAGKTFSLDSKVTPTSRDPFLGKLEEDHVLERLRPNHTVLEIGCGDASHTLNFAKKVRQMYALDVAKSLIEIAKKRAMKARASNVEFEAGSVLDVARMFKGKKIDCVISQRCLINLPTWAEQKKAILQIHKILNPHGLLLMTEGFQDELNNLNGLRRQVGLPDIRVVAYNRNFTHGEFDSFIAGHFEVKEVLDYGFYLFASRVYHPLAVRPEQPKHDSKLNEAACRLSYLVPAPDFVKYSYNLLYVLKKKKSN